MSGASPPLRSLWFGEGLTSATTEDSGRNSDATIHAPDVCRSRLDLRNTKSSSRQAATIVQKQRCETSSPARARAAVAANPRMLLQASRTPKRDGRAGLWPTRPCNSGTPFVPLTLLTRRSRQIRYSLIGPDKHLVNVSRTSLLASCRRSGRPRRHAGGRRPASAARRACRRLVILEVRRVLELVLGPADFELDHGGVVIAAGHGGIATRAGAAAAAGVGGNRLECAHIDGDALFADAEESAHTHDQPEDFAVLVEQHVTHIANVCVVGAEHIGAFELGEDPLVRVLRRDEFRGVMRGGRGGIVFRRRRFWRHIGLREGA